MTREEYNYLQTQLNNLMSDAMLRRKRIDGKYKEGYQLAILAVKSMVSSDFKPEVLRK